MNIQEVIIALEDLLGNYERNNVDNSFKVAIKEAIIRLSADANDRTTEALPIEVSNVRKEVLTDAIKVTCGPREQEYGSPKENFERIASYWSVYKGIEFTAPDIAMMMALLKVARIQGSNPSMDSFIDLAGYAACAAEVTLETHTVEVLSSFPTSEV